MSRFLLTRGLWLVFLELTVVSFAWSFFWPPMWLLQVIWALGWSMVGLSALVWLPKPAVLVIGLMIVAGHNLVDHFDAMKFGAFTGVWDFVHRPDLWSLGGFEAFEAYPILPWLGLISLAYEIGNIFKFPEAGIRLRWIGLGMIGLFLILRFTQEYGDARHWAVQANPALTAMDFFNVTKYPPSLDYVLITLGPVLCLYGVIDRLPMAVKSFFRTFGAVPLMAYVGHLYIMHALAIAGRVVTGQGLGGMFDTIRDFIKFPEQFHGAVFPLWGTYAGWVLMVALLYPLCRWWGEVKRTHTEWWLSYL